MDATWEAIESIKYIDEAKYAYEYVYDFSVKDIETFATKDGIIVHNTLNTFHQCGILSKSRVNQGVPRIRELISVSKKIKTPSMQIYFTPEYKKNKKVAMQLAHKIQMINMDFFIDNTQIWYDPNVLDSVIETDKKFLSDYYNFFDEIDVTKLSCWVLRIEIQPLYLMNKNISMLDIYYYLLKKFEKKYYNLHIIYSDEISEHNVFILRFTHNDINLLINEDKKIPCTNSDFEKLINIEKELTSDCLFNGIDQIKKVIISENTKETILYTIGSNLSEILQFEGNIIDASRTVSNDIHEVYCTLGIEAARNTLINEIYEVLNQSCVHVNMAHVSLLVDTMTLNGGLISMNRYGISKTDNGIFTMATFEEPDDHFQTAALYDISDSMLSTSSNVIMGQLCKFGTGAIDLIFDMDVFNMHAKPKEEYKNENDEETFINLNSKMF